MRLIYNLYFGNVGFGGEYFKLQGEESTRDVDICSKNKLLVLHEYKSVLNSKASEESLVSNWCCIKSLVICACMRILPNYCKHSYV